MRRVGNRRLSGQQQAAAGEPVTNERTVRIDRPGSSPQ